MRVGDITPPAVLDPIAVRRVSRACLREGREEMKAVRRSFCDIASRDRLARGSSGPNLAAGRT